MPRARYHRSLENTASENSRWIFWGSDPWTCSSSLYTPCCTFRLMAVFTHRFIHVSLSYYAVTDGLSAACRIILHTWLARQIGRNGSVSWEKDFTCDTFKWTPPTPGRVSNEHNLFSCDTQDDGKAIIRKGYQCDDRKWLISTVLKDEENSSIHVGFLQTG